MKGMIFTDFFEMVENVFSPEMLEKIIQESDLPNKGAYTDVGTYDHQELIRLVTNLSKATGAPIPDLELAYGKFLFTKLLNRYTKFVLSSKSVFEFLYQVDNHIHVEVLKLYPDAELPRFECSDKTPHSMTMKYQSNHPFSKLAEGLILGCAEYFKEKIDIKSKELGASNGKAFNVLFTLTKVE